MSNVSLGLCAKPYLQQGVAVAMDVIENLDVGVYSHFEYQSKKYPFFIDLVQPAYHVSGYVGVCVLLLIAVVLFFKRKKVLSAIVSAIIFGASVGLIEAIRRLVPRARPSDAINIVGSEDMTGSYPSRSVFLFMLGVILIGVALWPLMDRNWLRSAYVVSAALLTVWVCMSQFLLTTNFLTDIIGGMAGAGAMGWLASRLVEEEPPPAESPVVPNSSTAEGAGPLPAA